MARTPSGPLIVALLIGVTLSGCLAGPDHPEPDGIRHAPAGTTAPDFTVSTIDGQNRTLSDLRGKVVLLEFMGLGCGSCMRNLPDHKALYDAHRDDPRFVFLALNVWHAWCGDEGCGTVGESAADMRAFRTREGIGWDMALAPYSLVTAYNIQGTPTQFFIAHDGTVHGAGGRLSHETMTTEVDHLLRQVPSATDPSHARP